MNENPQDSNEIPKTEGDKSTFTITFNDGSTVECSKYYSDGTEIPISNEKVEPRIGRIEISDKYKIPISDGEKWTSEIPKDMMKAMRNVGIESEQSRKEHILKLLKDAGIDPSIGTFGGEFSDKDVDVDLTEEIRWAAKMAGGGGEAVMNTDYEKTFNEIYGITKSPKEPNAISVKSDETDVTIASKLYKDISVDEYFALNPSDRKQAFIELAKTFEKSDEKTLEMRKKMKESGVSCWFPCGGMTVEQAFAVVEDPEVQKLLKGEDDE